MIEKFLEDIGLSQKESVIYIALLRTGRTTVTDIAKEANIKRTTVYPVLESLKEKKLVYEVEEENKTFFYAEQPERLRRYFQEQKIAFEEREKLFDDFLPQIRGLQSRVGTQPVFKYYEGREELLESINDLFETESADNEMLLAYSEDAVEKMFTPAEIKLARATRIKKGITIKSIYSWSKGEKPPSENSQRVRIRDEKDYPLLCDVTIFGDKIRVYTGGEKTFALIIKSKEIAQTLKTLHKLAYERQSEKNKTEE